MSGENCVPPIGAYVPLMVLHMQLLGVQCALLMGLHVADILHLLVE